MMPKYTSKLADKICNLLSSGYSLAEICKRKDIPVIEGTVRLWDREDYKGFQAQYKRAREVQGEHYAAKVNETAYRVLDGDIRPDQGRVAIDAFKWTAGTLNNKYSAKQILTGPDGEEPVKVEAITRTIINPKNAT